MAETLPAYLRYQDWAQVVSLSYADVTLTPQKSSLPSRETADISAEFVPGLRLSIPIVGANMDTAMGWRMAIALARKGAIGVLPRFNTIGEQVADLDKVKCENRLVIEKPFTMSDAHSVQEARQILDQENVGGALVIDQDGNVTGLVTMRDVILMDREGDKRGVATVMKPRSQLVTAHTGISLEQARDVLHTNRIEKLPLVDDEGKIVGMITTQGILQMLDDDNSTKDDKGRLAVAVAIGMQPEDLERADELIAHGADAIVVDVAQGHHTGVIYTIQEVKRKYPNAKVVGGNIVTAEAARDLIDAGADAIKVGVGPGGFCTTRRVTGHGEGQVSAGMIVAKEAKPRNVRIIMDGGVEYSGDIVKAQAAGGDTVMLGTLLVGADESPARMVEGAHGVIYKVGRGMSARSASIDRDRVSGRKRKRVPAPEGIEGYVPYFGPVAVQMDKLAAGVGSGYSYSGAENLDALQQKAIFKKVEGGFGNESRPRAGDIMGIG